MHVPTLPSLPSWETPIAASREIVEAITDAADSAVDAATSVVRSARRRRRNTPAVVVVAVAAALVAVAVFVRARRNRRVDPVPPHIGADSTSSNDANGRVDGSAVPTTESMRDHRPVGAGTSSGRASNAD